MQTILLNKKDIYKGYLILVNEKYPLQKECKQKQLANIPNMNSNILLERTVANILSTVLRKVMKNQDITLVSGYRSLQEQMQIFSDSLQENGETFTRKYVALPNHSEHQTGYAIDLGIMQKELDFIRPDFPYNGTSQRFRNIADQYGFIERYQAGKENITKIAQEPWHFRYVGYPHSKIINDRHLCLEEYLEMIKQYAITNPYTFRQDYQNIDIFYVPSKKEVTKISIDKNCVYQVSGNNIDGFIITLWRNTYVS